MRPAQTIPSRTHFAIILLVNAAMWATAVLLTGQRGLAAIGTIAVISISTLGWKRIPTRHLVA